MINVEDSLSTDYVHVKGHGHIAARVRVRNEFLVEISSSVYRPEPVNILIVGEFCRNFVYIYVLEQDVCMIQIELNSIKFNYKIILHHCSDLKSDPLNLIHVYRSFSFAQGSPDFCVWEFEHRMDCIVVASRNRHLQGRRQVWRGSRGWEPFQMQDVCDFSSRSFNCWSSWRGC